jgi:hypothetical protein
MGVAVSHPTTEYYSLAMIGNPENGAPLPSSMQNRYPVSVHLFTFEILAEYWTGSQR